MNGTAKRTTKNATIIEIAGKILTMAGIAVATNSPEAHEVARCDPTMAVVTCAMDTTEGATTGTNNGMIVRDTI